MYHPYMPYPPFMPPINTSEDAWKLYKRIKKMEKEEKDGGKKDGKKDDKGRGLLSPFTTIQWLIILCTLGPITVPWYVLGIVNSWNSAAIAIKASLN
jgi:hypothetical protein